MGQVHTPVKLRLQPADRSQQATNRQDEERLM